MEGPEKDPLNGRQACPPHFLNREGRIYVYHFFETDFEPAGIELRTNVCGKGTRGSIGVYFEHATNWGFDVSLSLYDTFSVSGSGGGTKTGGVTASIDVTLPATPNTEYLAVGVVESVKIRQEQWWISTPPGVQLRRVSHGHRKAYFPRINYVLCSRKCGYSSEESDRRRIARSVTPACHVWRFRACSNRNGSAPRDDSASKSVRASTACPFSDAHARL